MLEMVGIQSYQLGFNEYGQVAIFSHNEWYEEGVMKTRIRSNTSFVTPELRIHSYGQKNDNELSDEQKLINELKELYNWVEINKTTYQKLESSNIFEPGEWRKMYSGDY